MASKKRHLTILSSLPLLGVLVVCISACTAGVLMPLPMTGAASVSGRVLEEGTAKPVEGALVAVYWEGIVPIKGSHVCFHVETAFTEKDGTFRTRAWSFPSPISYAEGEVRYRAYKPGMILHRENIFGVTLEMMRFPGTREERLEELLRLGNVADCEQPSLGIADMRDAIGQEMLQLIRTQDETREYLERMRELASFERERALRYQRLTADERKGSK